MSRKRRIVITTETQRIFVIRRISRSALAWCPGCAKPVKMVSPDEAAALLRVSSRAIYRCVEAEKLHFTETAEGLLVICLNSLRN